LIELDLNYSDSRTLIQVSLKKQFLSKYAYCWQFFLYILITNDVISILLFFCWRKFGFKNPWHYAALWYWIEIKVNLKLTEPNLRDILAYFYYIVISVFFLYRFLKCAEQLLDASLDANFGENCNANEPPTTHESGTDILQEGTFSPFSGSLEDLVNTFDEKITSCFRDYGTDVESLAPVQVRTQEEIMNECQWVVHRIIDTYPNDLKASIEMIIWHKG